MMVRGVPGTFFCQLRNCKSCVYWVLVGQKGCWLVRHDLVHKLCQEALDTGRGVWSTMGLTCGCLSLTALLLVSQDHTQTPQTKE